MNFLWGHGIFSLLNSEQQNHYRCLRHWLQMVAGQVRKDLGLQGASEVGETFLGARECLEPDRVRTRGPESIHSCIYRVGYPQTTRLGRKSLVYAFQ